MIQYKLQFPLLNVFTPFLETLYYLAVLCLLQLYSSRGGAIPDSCYMNILTVPNGILQGHMMCNDSAPHSSTICFA